MYGGKGLCRRPPSFKEIELCGVCSFHVIFFVPFISCGVLNKYISLHIDDTPSANPREYCPLDQSLADSQERGAKAFQLNSPPPLLVCHIWPGPASFVRKHSRAFIKSFPLLWPSKTFGNFVERRDQFWGCLTTHWWIMGSTKAQPLHRLWPCHIFCYHCKLPRGAAIFTPNPHGISDYHWCQRCTDSSRTVHTTTRDFPLFPSATAQISFSIIPYWIFMYKISLFDVDLLIVCGCNIPCRKRQTVVWDYTSYVSDGPGLLCWSVFITKARFCIGFKESRTSNTCTSPKNFFKRTIKKCLIWYTFLITKNTKKVLNRNISFRMTTLS